MQRPLPPDRYNLAKILTGILGCAYLAPWYAVVSAADYFESFFPRVEFSFALAYNLPLFISMLLVYRFGGSSGLAMRIIGGFIVFALTQGAMPLVGHSDASFYIYHLLIGSFAVADAIVQGSLFAITGLLGPRYTQAQLLGNGFSAVSIGALRILTKAIVPDDLAGKTLSALIYFVSTCCFMIVSIFCFVLLWELPFTRARIQRAQRAAGRGLLASSDNLPSSNTPVELESISERSLKDDKVAVLTVDTTVMGTDEDVEEELVDEEEIATTDGSGTASQILLRIWPDALCLWLTFVVTLSMFPGVTAQVKSSSLKDWFPVLLVSIFAVGDTIGRFAPVFHRVLYRWPRRVVRTLVVGRILLIVPFLMLILPSPENPLVQSDFFSCALMLIFSLSNGYLCAQLMMFAPELVPLAWREKAGTAMAVALVSGLSSGAILGFLISFAIKSPES